MPGSHGTGHPDSVTMTGRARLITNTSAKRVAYERPSIGDRSAEDFLDATLDEIEDAARKHVPGDSDRVRRLAVEYQKSLWSLCPPLSRQRVNAVLDPGIEALAPVGLFRVTRGWPSWRHRSGNPVST